MKKIFIAAAVALCLISTGAFAGADHDHEKGDVSVGRAGNPDNVSRTIEVEMSDTMRYTPPRITVKRGETIKFVAKNTGKLKHEMVLGSAKELREHAELMRKFPDMEHADPNQIAVEAGQTGELVWQFTEAGSFEFACFQPGHFEADMVGKIVVQP